MFVGEARSLPWGCIFSCVRSLYAPGVSDLDRSIEGSHMTKNIASGKAGQGHSSSFGLFVNNSRYIKLTGFVMYGFCSKLVCSSKPVKVTGNNQKH